ncbi:NAD-dependent epimerase/dehydratase family protein [Roseofilum casamattae]|uniref:NAD-dependent epimerase/dehydratase family protein n=1 Tax=Roseofilum casamattae BLCC-M143 TaxID=3022442 RepID=A0ABT7BZS0_9CYAN|nr:NAD-dependent epimerase/dehydratase family protein [Roseofilum casamattae]MDJ1183964.1 NAD-dependent epimerase/dehydratase family protein [Roseofilum casamattae BLCC-M143]
MKIGIIGCGYVGSACARYWYDCGHSLTVTTTTPERVSSLQQISDRVVVTQGSDPVALREAVRGQDILLLSVGANPRSRTAEGYKKTYLETAKTLVALLEEMPAVRQVIYTSSYQVYGDRNGEIGKENDALAPVSENGEILAETEQALLKAATIARNICIFRLGGIYGPNRELIKIYRLMAGMARPGTGAEATNWIHLEDIVGAISLGCDRQLDGIYNLVDNAKLTRKELLDRLFAQHQLPAVTWDATLPDPRPYNVWVSNEKLKDAGYTFRYGDRRVL